jgi:hypothetical protein
MSGARGGDIQQFVDGVDAVVGLGLAGPSRQATRQR